jgi:hypothetical protein
MGKTNFEYFFKEQIFVCEGELVALFLANVAGAIAILISAT